MKTWKRNVVVAALLLPVSSAVALAQTQAEMNKKTCDAYAQTDAELNTVYQQVLRDYQADARFVEKMRAAQRAWITYRDAQLAALYPAADPQREYGSAYAGCRCTTLAVATRKRIGELRQWTAGAAEGDACAGSIRARTKAEASSGMNPYERADSVFRKRWTLTGMGERSFATGGPYLEFDVKQGRFSGFSGCNRIAGGYRVGFGANGDDLKFTPVAATKRACPDAEAQQIEASFLKALEATTRFETQGDVVRLYAGDSPILVFGAGATGGAPAKASVTGTVTYRQRSALAPNAVIEVKLLDVSRADAPALTIAEQVIKPAGQQVPIGFALSYDPSRIDSRHRYAVQARILEDGKLRFISQTQYRVLTQGGTAQVEVVVQPVR